MLKKLILALAALTAMLTLVWAYYGGFASPAPVTEGVAGPYYIAYISHTGPHKKIGDVLGRLKDAIETAGITEYRAGGLFYDDPKIAGEEKCRSEAIAVLKKSDWEKLKGHAVLKTRVLERRSYLVTSFPFRGMLSVMAGVMKVYPLYADFSRANNIAPYVYREKNFENDYGIEIYGPEKILYYMTYKKGG